jgi:hypothetical protein
MFDELIPGLFAEVGAITGLWAGPFPPSRWSVRIHVIVLRGIYTGGYSSFNERKVCGVYDAVW